MEPLSHEQVRHIAKLAKLGLSDAEVEKYSHQLTSILEHAAVLNEINTEGVTPIAQITDLNNVLFADQVSPFEKPDELLSCSPMPKERHMIQVKSIL